MFDLTTTIISTLAVDRGCVSAASDIERLEGNVHERTHSPSSRHEPPSGLSVPPVWTGDKRGPTVADRRNESSTQYLVLPESSRKTRGAK